MLSKRNNFGLSYKITNFSVNFFQFDLNKYHLHLYRIKYNFLKVLVFTVNKIFSYVTKEHIVHKLNISPIKRGGLFQFTGNH